MTAENKNAGLLGTTVADNTTAARHAEAPEMLVMIDRAGIIVAAAVCDDYKGKDYRAQARRFLGRAPEGHQVVTVRGPVRLSAHYTNPMAYPAAPLALAGPVRTETR